MKKFNLNLKIRKPGSSKNNNRGSKKNRKKLYIGVSIATAAAVTGGVLYVNGRNTQVRADSSTEVQEATAETGTVSNSISGSGTLSAADGTSITIPAGLTLTEVEVESGDTVEQGDVLAKVDHSSILSAMQDVQDEIDAIDEEIAVMTGDNTETEDVTAGVSGTVTAVYAEEDASVTDTIADKGALVEIAVDGDTDNIVQVTAVDGTVSSISVEEGDEVDAGDTLLTVTIDENSSEYSSLMSQRSELAQTLQDLIEISETDTITAPEAGTIGTVNVSASSDSTSTGSSSGTDSSSAVGTSSTSGSTAVLTSYVTSATLLSSTVSTEATVTEESAGTTDTSSDTSTDTELSLAVLGSTDDSAALTIAMPVAGESPVTEVSASDGSWNATIVWTDSDGNELSSSDTFGYATTYRAGVTLTAADGYCFTEDSISQVSGYTLSGLTVSEDGKTISFVLTAPETAAESSSENTASSSDSGSSTSSGSNSSGSTVSSNSSSSGSDSTGSSSSGSTTGSTSGSSSSRSTGSSGSSSSGGSSSGSSGSGSSSNSSSATATSATTSTSTSDSSEDTSTTTTTEDSEVTAFTMVSEDTMTMTVSVDEQDINSVSTDQTATVTMDALEDVTLDGTVTSVSNSASSSGNGSAKYTVEISVPKQDGMLIGMSASATIVVEESENVVTIPADALQEKGTETYVYTEVDSDGNLSGETVVETGLSDGDTVEITSGLSEGDTVYYEKTGNVSSSDTSSGMQGGGMPSDSGSGSSGGQAPSGDMPSGSMPSGGGQAPSGS